MSSLSFTDSGKLVKELSFKLRPDQFGACKVEFGLPLDVDADDLVLSSSVYRVSSGTSARLQPQRVDTSDVWWLEEVGDEIIDPPCAVFRETHEHGPADHDFYEVDETEVTFSLYQADEGSEDAPGPLHGMRMAELKAEAARLGVLCQGNKTLKSSWVRSIRCALGEIAPSRLEIHLESISEYESSFLAEPSELYGPVLSIFKQRLC